MNESALSTLGWVDWSLLAVLLASVAIGLWRGLVYEVMSLAGWIVAYVSAQWGSPQVAPHFPVAEPGSAAQAGLAFAAVFIGALVAWTLLARLVRMLIRATPLTLLDRFFGAGFGVLRGGLVLLVIATAVAFTPAAQSEAWRDSHAGGLLSELLRSVKPALPEAVGRHLPA